MKPKKSPSIKKPNIFEYMEKFKALLPDLDTDFILTRAGTILMIHTFMMLTESYFQKEGTSKGRFVVLIRLLLSDSPDGENISMIRQFYPISNAALTGVLDTLEKDQMIERLPNPDDRRKVNIRITEAGRGFMMDFLPRHLENVKAMSGFVTEEEFAALLNTMKKLIHGIERFLSKGQEPPDSGPDPF